MMPDTPVIAYHFTADTLRDGRPIPPIGETLVHDGPVEICRSGLHASEHPFDALCYAPGPMLHRVKCEGIEQRDGDKLVCRRRTILASVDATQLLRRFVADQAPGVAHLWDMPDVVREYLTTLDDHKRSSARRAAWDAARTAARDAAEAAMAAWAATRDAARDAEAAWVAARGARTAGASAAWAEARAADEAARKHFYDRVTAEMGGHHA